MKCIKCKTADAVPIVLDGGILHFNLVIDAKGNTVKLALCNTCNNPRIIAKILEG